MKDLYKRNGLKPLESDAIKIHNCRSENSSDNEAAFAILLNKERKNKYDKLYVTLSKIGKLRKRYSLENVGDWVDQYADFLTVSIPPGKDLNSATAATNFIKGSINRFKYFGFGGVVVLIILVVIFNSGNNKNEETLNGNGALLKHAIEDATPIREAPNQDSKIIARLNKYDDVNVLKENSVKDWDAVEVDGKRAYVASNKLDNGEGYASYLNHCQSPSEPKPENGAYLFTAGSGPHSLIIVNPPGLDAVVKLKNESSQDVLAIYVYGGKSLTIDTIPEGSYQLWYAIGENYNAGCGHFLENARAWQLQNAMDFYMNSEGKLNYAETRLLTLKGPSLEAIPVDLRDF